MAKYLRRQAAITTSNDIMVNTKKFKQNSKVVCLYTSVCVLLACQVYLTDEGKTVTSPFDFNVETHFLSSVLKWPRKEKKTCSLKWTAFVLAHYTPAVWALNSLKLERPSSLSQVLLYCDWRNHKKHIRDTVLVSRKSLRNLSVIHVEDENIKGHQGLCPNIWWLFLEEIIL